MKKTITLITIVLLIAVSLPANAQTCAANAGYAPQVQSIQPSGGYGFSLGCPGCPGCPGNPIKKPGEPVCY